MCFTVEDDRSQVALAEGITKTDLDDLITSGIESFWAWFFSDLLKILVIFPMETQFESSIVEN